MSDDIVEPGDVSRGRASVSTIAAATSASPESPEDQHARLERALQEMLAVHRSRTSEFSRYRRLAGVTSLVGVLVILLIIGSLLALSHLSPKVLNGTQGSSITSTSVTSTTLVGGVPTLPQPGVRGHSGLWDYVATSRVSALVTSVGQGGQTDPLMRTTASSFVTDAAARPVIEYFWRPSCAACGTENLVVATALLDLGGTFSGLTAQSVGGGVSSISFRNARYHGPVVFEPIDTARGSRAAPGIPERQANAQFALYDRSPYTRTGPTLPFLDVASQFVAVGSGPPPSLVSGDSLQTIATALHVTHSPVAQAILGDANLLTAAICSTLTQLSRPLPPVCASGVIQQLEASLPASPPIH